ncbi:MAG: AAA family ATPase [Oscillospiraceae bacterium]|jgi:CO dehydrogenase maturation factor|nr:AAA family ATPase [Oscillospiraceae bacterium]
MSKLIAITGKGGVGKTTVSALLIKHLIASGAGPVLAIDADPNSCLDAALGVQVSHTVGRAREEVRETVSAGASVSKQELLHLKIEEGLVEAAGFDLIAMGRPEGPGCYCYANNVLKSVIAEISAQYTSVVLDNEAGLENLSRRIVQKVDLMVLVSDASDAGLRTLGRLYELSREMGMEYGRLALVVNRLRGAEPPERFRALQVSTGADIALALPDDTQLAQFAEQNRSLLTLPEDNAVYRLVGRLV